MVKLMGEDETYLDRLDHLWNENYGDIGDEVGFLPSFQYNYAEKGYSRTVDRTLDIYRTYFNGSLNGIPGNVSETRLKCALLPFSQASFLFLIFLIGRFRGRGRLCFLRKLRILPSRFNFGLPSLHSTLPLLRNHLSNFRKGR